MGDLGATPQNQLNALPLRTATDVALADVVTLTGTKVTAYWGPASSGINAVNYTVDPNDAALGILLTSYVNVTGFSNFVLVLVLDQAAGAVDIAVAHSVIPQYRAAGIAGVPPQSGNSIGGTMFSQAKAMTPSFGVLVTPLTVPIAFQWSNSNPVVNQPITLGSDCRLWLRRGAVPKAGQLYSAHLWAAQS